MYYGPMVLVRWEVCTLGHRVYMALKVTVTEWPTWPSYSRGSNICRRPTEVGQVSL